MDRIRLRWNWIEFRSNLVPSANAPLDDVLGVVGIDSGSVL